MRPLSIFLLASIIGELRERDLARAIIEVDLAKYKHVDLPVEDAIKLLEKIAERIGGKTNDISETIRYIRNFNEFYEYMRKKFKDYIAPPRRPDDYIKGKVVVDKVKLYMDGESKRVVIVFDRRVDIDLISSCLRELGYEVEVRKSF
jgi:hypothetical protein